MPSSPFPLSVLFSCLPLPALSFHFLSPPPFHFFPACAILCLSSPFHHPPHFPFPLQSSLCLPPYPSPRLSFLSPSPFLLLSFLISTQCQPSLPLFLCHSPHPSFPNFSPHAILLLPSPYVILLLPFSPPIHPHPFFLFMLPVPSLHSIFPLLSLNPSCSSPMTLMCCKMNTFGRVLWTHTATWTFCSGAATTTQAAMLVSEPSARAKMHTQLPSRAVLQSSASLGPLERWVIILHFFSACPTLSEFFFLLFFFLVLKDTGEWFLYSFSFCLPVFLCLHNHFLLLLFLFFFLFHHRHHHYC